MIIFQKFETTLEIKAHNPANSKLKCDPFVQKMDGILLLNTPFQQHYLYIVLSTKEYSYHGKLHR